MDETQKKYSVKKILGTVVLIILLLLLMSGDCQEEPNTALLTLALYLFL